MQDLGYLPKMSVPLVYLDIIVIVLDWWLRQQCVTKDMYATEIHQHQLPRMGSQEIDVRRGFIVNVGLMRWFLVPKGIFVQRSNFPMPLENAEPVFIARLARKFLRKLSVHPVTTAKPEQLSHYHAV